MSRTKQLKDILANLEVEFCLTFTIKYIQKEKIPLSRKARREIIIDKKKLT